MTKRSRTNIDLNDDPELLQSACDFLAHRGQSHLTRPNHVGKRGAPVPPPMNLSRQAREMQENASMNRTLRKLTFLALALAVVFLIMLAGGAA